MVSGVVAVAIVCVAFIIVLRKRRHTITLTESRGTNEFATPGVRVSATGMPPNMALFSHVDNEELVFLNSFLVL